jgi:hypothetical protein
MPTDSIVTISISLAGAGLTAPSFDKSLLLTCEAAWPERTRTYTTLAGVLADFPTITEATYLYAQQYFGQLVSPEELTIGRRALKPTLEYEIVINSVADDTDYTVYAGSEVATIDSGTGATADSIVDDLVDELNGILPAGWTASVETVVSGDDYIKIIATTPGTYLPVSIEKRTLLGLAMVHADAGVATDLAAIQLEDNTWYTVLDPFNSHAEIEAVAGWVESNKKLFLAQSVDSECATVALVSATDVMAHLKTASRDRTGVIYRGQLPSEATDAGWNGKMLPKDPGSETWAQKTISGSTVDSLTTTEQTNIEAKYGNCYVPWHGRGITFGLDNGGVVASGKFIDAVRFRDWLEATMQIDIAQLIVDVDKIPQDDTGIAMVEAVVRRRLDLGIQAGGIAKYPAYTVTFPAMADVTTSDRLHRHLRGSFTATGNGALQGFTISGVIA